MATRKERARIANRSDVARRGGSAVLRVTGDPAAAILEENLKQLGVELGKLAARTELARRRGYGLEHLLIGLTLTAVLLFSLMRFLHQ